MSSHAETILAQLHDQYVRGIDCDVILRSVDHLKRQNDSQTSNAAGTSCEADNACITLHCHRNVIRAASSFFDRIFSKNVTEESSEVEEGVEAILVAENRGTQYILQLTFHKISSHSIHAFVEFAYTGCVKVDSNVLRKVIEDLKCMNMQSFLDNLSFVLEEGVSYSNCIRNLILSYMLGKAEVYKKVMFFVLDEFSRGIKRGEVFETPWKNILESKLPLGETSMAFLADLKIEAEKIATLGLTEDSALVKILIQVIETNSISKDEELKLVSFLITKRREKCADHLQNILLYCNTDREQLCTQCLVKSHVKHHIEPIDTAVCTQLAPYWNNVDKKLEDVKQSSKDRFAELENLSNLIRAEKSRELAILDVCAEIKPKMDNLSHIFKTGKINPSDTDSLALEKFLASLKEDSKQLKEQYEKAKKVSDELLNIMYKRSIGCASIIDTVSEVESFEDSLEIGIHQPLTTTNCVSILKATQNSENQEIFDQAFDFLCVNFIQIFHHCGTSFHRRITFTVLEKLLKSSKLKVKSEDDVVLIGKEWLNFDIRQRKKFAAQLLKQVKFAHVSEEVLESFQNDSSYLALLNDETKKLVEDAFGDCIRNPRISTVNRKLLVFGENGVIFSYSVERESWEEWEGGNHGKEFGAVIVGENVFIMGGETKIDGKCHRLSRVSIYNVRTKKWQKGPSMRERRCIFGACVAPDNTIYVIGGFRDDYDYLSSVESLKCNENGQPSVKWKVLPSMSKALFGLAATVIDDKVYAVGGCDGEFLAPVEVFYPKLNVWKKYRPMSHERYALSVATYNEELYVFGEDGVCEKYNPVTDTWTPIASCPGGGTRFRGSAVLDGKIYLVGGCGCKETDIYDPKTNTWSKGAQLSRAIGVTKCVAWT